jgi:CheY-like chemotaxis protein
MKGKRESGPLILVVEDNRDLRDLYSMYFTSHGFLVQAASDGQMAIVAAVEHRPDLIVTDLSMPHLGGHEMTRRLRSDPRTAHIPVLACTGYPLSAESALEAGCDGFVVKPCLPEDLLREARRLLAGRAHRRSA